MLLSFAKSALDTCGSAVYLFIINQTLTLTWVAYIYIYSAVSYDLS